MEMQVGHFEFDPVEIVLLPKTAHFFIVMV